MTKNLLVLAGLAFASSSAFAGHEMSGKELKQAAEPCFKDTELQVDVFGSFTAPSSGSAHDDGFGGGIGVNYFFQRHFGVGIDGNVYNGGVQGVFDVTARIIARYPLELGSFCLAPYVFGGGGVQTNGVTNGTWLAGGGLEWRATEQFGVFGEGRYTWGSADSDAAQARIGVRVVF
jgi:hypothetical protein